MRGLELAMAAAFTLLGGGVLWTIFAVMLPDGAAGGDAFSDSALFPGIVAVALAALALGDGVAALRHIPATLENAPQYARLLSGLGLTSAFIFALPLVGYSIAAVALSLAVLLLLGVRRIWVLALAGVAMPLAVQLLFERVLGVILPYGTLWSEI